MYSTIHVSKSWARPSLSPFSCVHGALRYSKKCKFQGNILEHSNNSSYFEEWIFCLEALLHYFFLHFIVHCYAWRRVNSSIIFQVVYITCETFIWRHYYYNWAFFVCVSFSKVIFSPSTCLAHGGMNLKKNAQNCEANFSKKKLVKNLVDFPGQLQTCSSRSQDNWELLCSIGLTFKGLQLPSFWFLDLLVSWIYFFRRSICQTFWHLQFKMILNVVVDTLVMTSVTSTTCLRSFYANYKQFRNQFHGEKKSNYV